MTAAAVPPLPFQYAVLRAVPRVERGESINIGVILYCQRADFLAARTAVPADRLRALWPEVDVDAICAAAEAIGRACARPVGSARENRGLLVRFGMLTAPRSTMVQPGPVHAGVTTDPAVTLDDLFARLVALPRGSAG